MKQLKAIEKLAQILRTDFFYLKEFFLKIEEKFKVKNLAFKIVQENEIRIIKALKELEISLKPSFEEVSQALMARAENDDYLLRKNLKFRNYASLKDWQRAISKIKNSNSLSSLNLFKGLFLKKNFLKTILRKTPPRVLLKVLKYKNVDELLKKENFFEIMASLRFVEGSNWMNEVFLNQYQKLSLSEFEEREIEILVLSKKWQNLAQKFIEKKYHNLSHLKEIGLIFLIPEKEDFSGKFLRDFSLILHYLFEISFYNQLFKIFLKKKNFSKIFRETLKGKEPRFNKNLSQKVFILQRYLAKENPFDKRLFLAHLNTEAFHWQEAIKALIEIGFEINKEELDFSFWKNLEWVGDFFENQLISFDLIDNLMSLIKKQDNFKYLYHHQEALWNKIFEKILGKQELKKLVLKNWLKKTLDF